jgi:hypothetical protein
MGHVIELRRARAVREPAPNALVRCARCGADLWHLFADGRVRCADCEEECPLRTVPGSGTGSGHEYEMNKGE